MRQVAVVLYLLALVAVVVGVDMLFFRHHFWEQLLVNVPAATDPPPDLDSEISATALDATAQAVIACQAMPHMNYRA